MNRSARVLIVEDDPDVAEALRDTLEYEGFLVAHASHGKDALDRLRAEPALPDVILLDLMMPVLDGNGFRAAQVSDPRLAPLPVVLVSADRDADARARELGVARFLPKPFDATALTEAVRACLPIADGSDPTSGGS